jgi:hypothetical protein
MGQPSIEDEEEDDYEQNNLRSLLRSAKAMARQAATKVEE